MQVATNQRCALVLALALAWLLSAPPGRAVIYEVRPDGSGDFPTIQEALLGVEDGDVIELTAGVFAGPGNRDIHFLGRVVTVRSRSGDPADVVIDCEGSPQDPHRGFNFEDEEERDTILEGVTIRNGYAIGES